MLCLTPKMETFTCTTVCPETALRCLEASGHVFDGVSSLDASFYSGNAGAASLCRERWFGQGSAAAFWKGPKSKRFRLQGPHVVLCFYELVTLHPLVACSLDRQPRGVSLCDTLQTPASRPGSGPGTPTASCVLAGENVTVRCLRKMGVLPALPSEGVVRIGGFTYDLLCTK